MQLSNNITTQIFEPPGTIFVTNVTDTESIFDPKFNPKARYKRT